MEVDAQEILIILLLIASSVRTESPTPFSGKVDPKLNVVPLDPAPVQTTSLNLTKPANASTKLINIGNAEKVPGSYSLALTAPTFTMLLDVVKPIKPVTTATATKPVTTIAKKPIITIGKKPTAKDIPLAINSGIPAVPPLPKVKTTASLLVTNPGKSLQSNAPAAFAKNYPNAKSKTDTDTAASPSADVQADSNFAAASTASASMSPIIVKTDDDRIIGGVPAKISEFPFIVSIQVNRGYFNGYRQYCDGTILTPNWVLTAGHCCGLPSTKYRIVAGEDDQSVRSGHEQIVNVMFIQKPRKFNIKTIDYDICMMNVHPAFIINDFVKETVLTPVKEGFKGTSEAAGWGITANGATTTPPILQKIALPLIAQDECEKIYADTNQITDRMMCAGYYAGRNVCHGDSGGPLLCETVEDSETVQCGIVSWGVGCAFKGFPGVFSRVSVFRPWINCVISQGSFCNYLV